MIAMIARDVRKTESRWRLFDSEELENKLHTARASRDHFEELRELGMMRLPSCVMALTVSEMGVP